MSEAKKTYLKDLDPPQDQSDNQSVQRFCGDEEGSTTVLTLFIVLFMLVMAGLGIDTMRYEMERTHLQATLDSAVLAGAGAPVGTDKSDIKAIVEDYFAKAEMSDYLHAIDADGEGEDDIVATLNATSVYAEASMEMDTYLMKLSGVKSLGAGAAAAAEIRQPKLEVVLVLDVSGSMSGDKLANLKVAAKEFVTTVLGSSNSGDTVITIVPFSWSVTPGWTIFDALAVDKKQNYSTCLKFKDNDFNHATLTTGASATSNGVPVNQMIYTSVYGGFDDLSSGWRSCFTDTYMEITPYSFDEAHLHSRIDAMQAAGNTSGHQGMNWGSALLDPSFQAISADLIAAGEIDASLSTVPAPYTDRDTLKAIIVMGDGANTTSYFFDVSNPEYRGAHSDLHEVTYTDQVFKYAYHIYKHKKSYDQSKCGKPKWDCVYEGNGTEKSAYFLEDPDDGNFYNLEEEEWISAAEFNDLENTLDGFISSEQLDWEMAWGLMSPDFYKDITGNSGPWNDYVASEYLNGAAKNERMLNNCAATKTQGVVVYSIGFEVPAGGTAETVLTACASSGNHYYPAEGTNISTAFNSIASNLQNLRLTQ